MDLLIESWKLDAVLWEYSRLWPARLQCYWPQHLVSIVCFDPLDPGIACYTKSLWSLCSKLKCHITKEKQLNSDDLILMKLCRSHNIPGVVLTCNIPVQSILKAAWDFISSRDSEMVQWFVFSWLNGTGLWKADPTWKAEGMPCPPWYRVGTPTNPARRDCYTVKACWMWETVKGHEAWFVIDWLAHVSTCVID